MKEAVFLILLIAGGQGIFISLVLLLNKAKRFSVVLLGLLFLSFSLQLFDFILLYSGQALSYPHLTFISTPFNLALGPLLYLYIRSSKTDIERFKKIQLLHFLPFIIHSIYVLIIYHLHDATYKLAFIQDILTVQLQPEQSKAGLANLAFTITVYGQLAIYLWISRKQILKSDAFSLKMNLWLKKLWLAILVIGTFALLQFLLVIFNINQQPYTGYIAASMAVIYIYYGAMIVMKKPEVVFNAPTIRKYQYSSLTEEESKQLLTELRQFMDQHGPFRNPDLTLKELANDSGLAQKRISQVINEQLNQNFHDFVNEYRIEHFKKCLGDPANNHLSILGIAMDCGFNSKSTFNTAFKRSTGLTPSEYKKQNNQPI